MSIVKTVQELTEERRNHCSSALAKKYLNSVRAIYGSTEQGKPVHIGSCVAVNLQQGKYLITAAHVVDENIYTSLYISGEQSLVLIEAAAFVTSAPNGDRDKDQIDFAILKLSDELIINIGNIEYISESDILLRDLKENEKCCLALGYPNSKNKLNPQNGSHLKTTPFIYTSTLKFDDELYKQIGISKEQHYLLDYCHKHSKDESNQTVNSIHPKGVSGGALIYVEGMTNPESYRPDTKCTGKLIGILIEFKKAHKVLLYTKISTVLFCLKSNTN